MTIDKLLKIEAEEKEKEAIYFWPKRNFSTKLISMADQVIKDKHLKLGSYDYKPFPLPDHVNRTFKRVKYQNGSRYEGELNEQGIPDGRGIGLLHSGNLYEGYFKDGEFNGRGRLITKSGELIDGEWKDSLKHGFCLYVWPNN